MIRKILAIFAALVSMLSAADLLYNGVRLPEVWPPRDVKLTQEPLPTPPYLLEPPDVIPIEVGRQLFVDDFLIESTDLRRTFHRPDYFEGNPVLKADKPWEFVEGVGKAMPFSDGVFWDPSDNLFKAWYLSAAGTLYATSRDGVRWDKPALDIRPGTNVVHTAKRDSACVWLDLDERDPQRRFKFLYMPGHMRPATLHYSPDGVHWGDPVAKSIPWSDRTTFFRNPFRNVWVFSLRDHDWTPGQPENKEHLGRLRRYQESADLAAGLAWKKDEPVSWVSADRLDARRVDLNAQPQLYNLDAVAYESLIVGLFSIWRGQFTDREKPNEITVGFTRDGFHWHRPDRNAFLPISDRFGDWNYSNVQSAGGVLLVVGDRIYFYVSGRAGAQGVRTSGATTMGLATLRRDGFASMDATQPGQLTTRPVRFAGKHLFVNVESAPGELRVEVLDRHGRVLPGFSKADCLPVQIDNTAQAVRWKGKSDLSALAGQPVRFRFHLRDARLYAFWVSPSESGASMGYVGAGGPGIPGNRDIVGTQAYRTCCKGSTW
ncbi:MAG TPA: hypothetical protein VN442_07095 [Bryobacteraceae bacterium]|nr:hypothetical protein [Bryobacteraceae bacterium]